MMKQSTRAFISGLAVLLLVACSGRGEPAAAAASGSGSGAVAPQPPGAEIRMDGSSTLLPLSEAVAEEFQKQRPSRVTVRASGTGGGFQKFCSGEVDLAGASRPIRPAEARACADKGVAFVEVAVAYDALSVVVNPQNSWVDFLTVEELKRMWAPDSQKRVTKWSQVRSSWPDEEIRLFGAGVDSGTYDYFTKAIVGAEHASRGDYTSSEDDNVLVQGVSSDKLALGFFGYSYFAENAGKLRVVPIDDGIAANGPGPVAPSPATVLAGTYQPLARPLFVYVSAASLARPEVKELVGFYVANASRLAKEVGFIPLAASTSAAVQARFAAGKTGTIFPDGSSVGVKLDEVLKASEAGVAAGSGSGAPSGK